MLLGCSRRQRLQEREQLVSEGLLLSVVERVIEVCGACRRNQATALVTTRGGQTGLARAHQMQRCCAVQRTSVDFVHERLLVRGRVVDEAMTTLHMKQNIHHVKQRLYHVKQKYIT